MCPLLIVYGLGLLAGGWLQDPLLESHAVARIQQTPASRFDAGLPARPFGIWLKQTVGPQAGISWQLTDCGEPAGGNVLDADRPMCVEATAALADDRKIVVMISVGTVRQALLDKSKVYLAVIEQNGSLYSIDRLKDVPEMLKAPKLRVRRRAPILPNLSVRKAAPLIAAPAPIPTGTSFGKPPAIARGDEPPPPRRGPRRVSEGVLQGNVINRVMPVYPQVARQLNHSGEVVVEVVISEDGRVISANAVSGSMILRESAETAARKWIFKPTMLNGLPVQTRGTLTFVFNRH